MNVTRDASTTTSSAASTRARTAIGDVGCAERVELAAERDAEHIITVVVGAGYVARPTGRDLGRQQGISPACRSDFAEQPGRCRWMVIETEHDVFEVHHSPEDVV